MRVRVPASSANLGPGFDCFGIAWQLYDEIEFSLDAEGLEFAGCDEKYMNEKNLAYAAYRAVLERYGLKNEAVKITFCRSDIPISRGLGSSSALLVAGVMAANELHGLNMSKNELFAIATTLEGHPDNVAPAIFGGLTASAMDGDRPLSAHFDISPKLRFTALIPPFELSTSESRSVLPHEVPRADAIFNVSRAALLLSALGSGDVGLLRCSMADRLHEPYRIPLIKGFDIARGLAYKCGAISMCISGAGSTLLCVSQDEGFRGRIEEDLYKTLASWRAVDLKPELSGASVLDI
ncbi:MAG: homoserine kinase [Candidatus Limivicinus sp.]|jgi:homoserine kinase